MSILKRITRYTLLAFALVLLLVLFVPSRTPSIDGKNSIATMETIQLGDLDQSIIMRGSDKNHPILLFLHGGPGYAQIAYARKYQEKLEQSFVVVNWDQRGAGKSYTPSIPPESMTRDQFVEDTHELIDYLCTRFDKEKIYLVGHSWGSELGMYVVQKYPDHIAAFISIGQLVNGQENEKLSYDYTMSQAKASQNQKAINELTKIGRPPYKNLVQDMMVERKWLKTFGGAEKQVDTYKDMILASIFSPEYRGIDGIKLAIGSKFTADLMFPQTFLHLDIMKDIPKIDVPIYFCVGRSDYNTPHQLTVEYFDMIEAPSKELIWFEESAHFPHFEEPEKFYKLLKSITHP